MNRFFAALSLVLLSGCQPALAAETAAMTSWSDVAREAALTMASAIVTVAITIAVAQFAKWTGIEVEARQREALHSAAMTGISLAIAKYGPSFGIAPSERSDVVRYAVGWVLSAGAPGAVAGLKLTDAEVGNLVESKLGALAGASAVTKEPTPSGA